MKTNTKFTSILLITLAILNNLVQSDNSSNKKSNRMLTITQNDASKATLITTGVVIGAGIAYKALKPAATDINQLSSMAQTILKNGAKVTEDSDVPTPSSGDDLIDASSSGNDLIDTPISADALSELPSDVLPQIPDDVASFGDVSTDLPDLNALSDVEEIAELSEELLP